MKKIIFCTALLSLPMTATIAGDFDGAYLGVNAGKNSSSATSNPDKSQMYLGGKAGYNWNLNGFILGAEGLLDWHADSYTYRDVGLDARIGYPNEHWMPYARLGVMATFPGERPHVGLGVEYSLSERWTMNAEWTTDSKTLDATTFKNNNLTVGLNMRLGVGSTKTAPVDNGAARRAAADKAAADKATADKAASDRAAAERAAADRTAHPVYYKLVAGENIVLERTFPFSKVDMYASSFTDMDEVARFASAHKEANFVVTGYTDDVGSEKANYDLSVERANAAKAYLVKQGVSADRISTKGAGKSHPVADDKSEESRARNRRVEIVAPTQEGNKITLH